MSGGCIRKSNLPRMTNRNYPKKMAKTICHKKMETGKSKEKIAVSKAESARKADSAKA